MESRIDLKYPAYGLLFEISWEVCSQSGGIYTVLRSKAPSATQRWGQNYHLIGPYHEASARVEFEPQRFDDEVGEAVAELAARKLIVHSGRWLITGRPRVLLIDLASVEPLVNEFKYYLWKDDGVSSPDSDAELNGYMAFGAGITELMVALRGKLDQRPLLAHFHEWQSAAALPRLPRRGVRIPTVFTTHATLVGRSLSAANVELYDRLDEFNAESIATQHGFLHRFQLERAAARGADVFTTVSDITAQEAEVFLGRRPEALLPNGLNVERFAAPHEFQNLHQRSKELIHEFVMGHFFPSHSFDLHRTLYVFSAGRYEYRNKGLDVFIDSLVELNRRLKAEHCDTTVVAFIVTRAPYRGLNVETLNRQIMFRELQKTCESIREEIGRRLFETVAMGRLPTSEELIDEYARVRLKRIMYASRRSNLPLIVTHDLEDDLHDPVLVHLRRARLHNAADDPVKVVYHPEFVTTASPLLRMEYDQFVRGCNLGVFPSYYEPWGYTPMECIVRGVPAITSDLSGFGSYLMDRFPDHDGNGMFVARRRSVSYQTTVYQVANWLHQLAVMPLRERIAMRNRVEQFADHFDWKGMTQYYRAARRMAFERHYPGRECQPPIPTSWAH